MTEGAGRPLRLLFWNAFLLRPRPVRGGPALPAIGELAAPATPERADAIGRELAGRYDIVAFSEAFDPAERARVVAAWRDRPGAAWAVGPERSFPPRGPLAFASSGLLTVTDGVTLTRTEQHRFHVRGLRRHDADAWSNKGVLLAEVDPGLGAGRIEVYSTHLLWGTGIFGGGRAADPERRHALRMSQVDELVAFVRRSHRPGNVVVVVGDFNVPAHDPRQAPPDRWHRDLSDRLGALGLVDTWVARGVGPGFSCGPAADPFDEEDPDQPGHLHDDPEADPAGHPDRPERERIDYVWVQEPQADHALAVTFDRPRRRAFPRPPGARRHADLPRLSDHLALSVELTVSPR